jgi:hypothetical protein
LTKGAAHAAARKIDESVFLSARLYPDMLPFARQIHIASDFARGTVARLAAANRRSGRTTRTTFAELIARGRPHHRSRQGVLGRADRRLRRTSRDATGPRRAEDFQRINYLLQYSMPNFYFHATTAYAILRSNGVELGKADSSAHSIEGWKNFRGEHRGASAIGKESNVVA